MAKEKAFVFYSWQTDSPAKCNKSLIEAALSVAIKNIAGDASNAYAPVLEQDARNSPGSPDIHREIFDKIDRAHVVVADATIIGKAGRRWCINPNVGIELGYALAARTHKRVVLVQNTHFGKPERLPFDIRPKVVSQYKSDPKNKDRATPRHGLARALEASIRSILAMGSAAVASPVEVFLTFRRHQAWTPKHQHFLVRALMKNVSDKTLKDWQLELRLPRALKNDGIQYGMEEPTPLTQPRRFLFDSTSPKTAAQWIKLLPDDERTFEVGCVVDEELQADAATYKHGIAVRALVDGAISGEVTKTVMEMSTSA